MSFIEKRFRADQFTNKILERNGKLGRDACEIMATSINAVDAYRCVLDQICIKDQNLQIGTQYFNLLSIGRIILLGFGKASVPMAKAVIDQMQGRLSFAEVITKDHQFLKDSGYKGILNVHLGGHPIPSKASIDETRRLMEGLPNLTEEDLVIVLISGGGSALFTDPLPRIHLNDLQKMTQILLDCGANINEINTLRKHIDQVKGGRLARRLQPAMIYSLIMSDVIGDHLDMIASGPTVPDPTTYTDAMAIIEKYNLKSKISSTILNALKKGERGEIPETLKAQEIPSSRLYHTLVATNFSAAKAALAMAENHGYLSLIITSQLSGLTKDFDNFLNGVIQTEIQYGHPVKKPLCLIFGGETTVKVEGDGLGGRNQDLVLRMVEKISGITGLILISLSTDGEDGPTDAAGAVADGLVFQEGAGSYDLDVHEFIQRNDAYHYFDHLGGLIKIGATGTNVNDLVILLMKS